MARIENFISDLVPKDNIGNWYQADLHVHSPASPDFYVPNSSDDSFLELIQQANDRNIKIICITDHNDISGYYRLHAIENEVRNVKEGLEKREIPIPGKIKQQVDLFDQVIYLPGVELDIYPNLHLIVIFDPTDTEEAISNFLNRAGYPPNIRGDETASRNAALTFTQAIQESEKIGAVTIAAHIDSSKGLYEESKSWGQSRIEAFTHPYLWAMEFIKTSSRDQIQSLLKGDPNYLRKSPLAFIQSSDFHGKPGQRVGDRRTFIRIDNFVHYNKKLIFEEIKTALRNPDEYISAPESPQVSTILKKLENAPFIEDIKSEEDKLQVFRYVCAFSNTEDGTIVIGRNIKGNWVGIEIENPDEFPKKMISLIRDNVIPQIVGAIGLYEFSSNRFICTIRVQKQSKIHMVSQDDRVYVYENGKPSPLPTKKIIELAELNLAERYNYLSISKRVSDISSKLSGLQDTIDILSIVKKIEARTTRLANVLKSPSLGGIVTDDLKENIDFYANGCPDGNVIITPAKVSPRFDDHYLRLSAPIGIMDDKKILAT